MIRPITRARFWFVSLLLAAAPVLLSCSGSLQAARDEGRIQRRLGTVSATAPSPRCQSLDSRRTLHGGLATTAIALGGAAGLSLLLPEVRGDKWARAAVIGGSVSFAATGEGLQVVANGETAAWTRECGQ